MYDRENVDRAFKALENVGGVNLDDFMFMKQDANFYHFKNSLTRQYIFIIIPDADGKTWGSDRFIK